MIFGMCQLKHFKPTALYLLLFPPQKMDIHLSSNSNKYRCVQKKNLKKILQQNSKIASCLENYQRNPILTVFTTILKHKHSI